MKSLQFAFMLAIGPMPTLVLQAANSAESPADASAAAKWKNVTFGKGCLSKDPKELIREYKGQMNRGQPSESLKPEKKYTSM